MTQQTIGVGTVADDGTGDTLRAAFTKANANFTELYLTATYNTWAEGSYVKYGNGTLECWYVYDDTAGAWTTAAGSQFIRSSVFQWTFPTAVPFIALPTVHVETAVPGAAFVSGCGLRSNGLLSVNMHPWCNTSCAAAVGKFIHLRAIGRWA